MVVLATYGSVKISVGTVLLFSSYPDGFFKAKSINQHE